MTLDIQTFAPGNGTWSKPAGAQWVEMFAIGGGGMGGPGAVGGAGTNRYGGGGGESGAWSRTLYAAADLPSSISVRCGYAGGDVAALGQQRIISAAVPATLQVGAQYTLGTKFQVLANGRITHLRYYREGQAAHILSLWTAAGVKLATVTDVASASAGWRELVLSTPVFVFYGDYLMASFTQDNVARRDGSAFTGSLSPYMGSPEGWYVAGAAEAFPTTGPAAGGNYSVDVVFEVFPWGDASYVGASQDAAWCWAGGGQSGGNGSTGAAGPGGSGQAANGEFAGAAGAAGAVGTPGQPGGSQRTGPGGGGGGVNSGNGQSAGGVGGNNFVAGYRPVGGNVAAGGNVGGGAGAAGESFGSTVSPVGGYGGGGGGGNNAGAGGKGGAGGFPGGGGGGGGGGTTAQGQGGLGGAGLVVIVTWTNA